MCFRFLGLILICFFLSTLPFSKDRAIPGPRKVVFILDFLSFFHSFFSPFMLRFFSPSPTLSIFVSWCLLLPVVVYIQKKKTRGYVLRIIRDVGTVVNCDT